MPLQDKYTSDSKGMTDEEIQTELNKLMEYDNLDDEFLNEIVTLNEQLRMREKAGLLAPLTIEIGLSLVGGKIANLIIEDGQKMLSMAEKASDPMDLTNWIPFFDGLEHAYNGIFGGVMDEHRATIDSDVYNPKLLTEPLEKFAEEYGDQLGEQLEPRQIIDIEYAIISHLDKLSLVKTHNLPKGGYDKHQEEIAKWKAELEFYKKERQESVQRILKEEELAKSNSSENDDSTMPEFEDYITLGLKDYADSSQMAYGWGYGDYNFDLNDNIDSKAPLADQLIQQTREVDNPFSITPFDADSIWGDFDSLLETDPATGEMKYTVRAEVAYEYADIPDIEMRASIPTVEDMQKDWDNLISSIVTDELPMMTFGDMPDSSPGNQNSPLQLPPVMFGDTPASQLDDWANAGFPAIESEYYSLQPLYYGGDIRGEAGPNQNKGRRPRAFADGGYVAGYGIYSMGEEGPEYVMSNNALNMYGLDFMRDVNAGRLGAGGSRENAIGSLFNDGKRQTNYKVNISTSNNQGDQELKELMKQVLHKLSEQDNRTQNITVNTDNPTGFRSYLESGGNEEIQKKLNDANKYGY